MRVFLLHIQIVLGGIYYNKNMRLMGNGSKRAQDPESQRITTYLLESDLRIKRG